MKNKFLKLMALFVASAFVGNAGAQLTDGTYYLENKATGRFISSGHNWFTRSTLSPVIDYPITLKASGDGYILGTYGSNSLGHNLYVDNSSNDVWLINAVVGEDNVYTISSNGTNYLGSDGTLVLSGSLTDPTSDAAKWYIRTKEDYLTDFQNAKADNPVNASFFITGPSYDYTDTNRGNAWTNDGFSLSTELTRGSSTTAINPYVAEKWNGTATIKQTLTGLPAGVYAVGVYGFYRDGDANGAATNYSNNTYKANAYLYAGDSQIPLKSICSEAQSTSGTGFTTSTNVGYVPNQRSQAGEAFAHGYYQNTLLVRVDEDGSSLEIGIKKESTISNDWAIVDNWFLKYYGDVTINEVVLVEYIKAYNAALDEAKTYQAVDMFDEDKAKLDEAITTNTLDLSSATEALLEEATANLKAATENAKIAANKYDTYTKTNQLITEAGDVAEVDLTSLIINPGFEQGNIGGWTNSGTQAAGAQGNKSFDNTQGNYYAERWHAAGTVDLNQTLASLPAGIYMLSAYVFSDTQDAKLYANEKATSFSTSGLYSVLVEIEDKGEIKFGASCTLTDNTWICMDGFTLSYMNDLTYTLVEGKMSVAAADAQTAAAATFQAEKTLANYDAVLAAIREAEASKAAYENLNAAIAKAEEIIANTYVYVEADKVAYQAAIDEAKAAYEDGSYDGTATMIEKLWNTEHQSSVLLARPFISSAWSDDNTVYTNNWSTEADNKENGSGMTAPFIEYWVADANSLGEKTIDAVIGDLEVGEYYELSALVRVRIKNDATEATGITMDVNGTSVNVCDGATCDDGTPFRYGTYSAIVKIGEDGNLTVAFNVAAENTISWLSFKDVKYTKVDFVPADEADYAALNAAIDAADAKVIGFLAGEYAPYNNIEVVQALAAAKAIDVTANNEKDAIQAATAAIAEDKWDVNETEMNAVYDGSFNLTTATSGSYIVPTGWTDLGYNTRVYNSSNMENNTGVAAASQSACLFAKFTTEYGTVEGYTMPLKAGVYTLEFIYGGWNETGTREIKIYNSDNSAEVLPTATVTAKNNKAHTDPSAWSQYSGKFVIPADGNYVLSFYRQNTTSQNQICISDLKIYSVPETEVTMNISDAKYATFIAPFDVEIPEGVTASKITGVEGNVLTEEPVEGTIPANTPVVLYSENIVSKTFSGQSLATADTYTEGLLTGTYVQTTATANTYVLQNHDGKVAFYLVGEVLPEIGANRCFLTVPAESAGAPMFSLERGEGTTSIENAELTNETVVIYDLAGRRVEKMEKGIYIVNGKKVIR